MGDSLGAGGSNVPLPCAAPTRGLPRPASAARLSLASSVTADLAAMAAAAAAAPPPPPTALEELARRRFSEVVEMVRNAGVPLRVAAKVQRLLAEVAQAAAAAATAAAAAAAASPPPLAPTEAERGDAAASAAAGVVRPILEGIVARVVDVEGPERLLRKMQRDLDAAKGLLLQVCEREIMGVGGGGRGGAEAEANPYPTCRVCAEQKVSRLASATGLSRSGLLKEVALLRCSLVSPREREENEEGEREEGEASQAKSGGGRGGSIRMRRLAYRPLFRDVFGYVRDVAAEEDVEGTERRLFLPGVEDGCRGGGRGAGPAAATEALQSLRRLRRCSVVQRSAALRVREEAGAAAAALRDLRADASRWRRGVEEAMASAAAGVGAALDALACAELYAARCGRGAAEVVRLAARGRVEGAASAAAAATALLPREQQCLPEGVRLPLAAALRSVAEAFAVPTAAVATSPPPQEAATAVAATQTVRQQLVSSVATAVFPDVAAARAACPMPARVLLQWRGDGVGGAGEVRQARPNPDGLCAGLEMVSRQACALAWAKLREHLACRRLAKRIRAAGSGGGDNGSTAGALLETLWRHRAADVGARLAALRVRRRSLTAALLRAAADTFQQQQQRAPTPLKPRPPQPPARAASSLAGAKSAPCPQAQAPPPARRRPMSAAVERRSTWSSGDFAAVRRGSMALLPRGGSADGGGGGAVLRRAGSASQLSRKLSASRIRRGSAVSAALAKEPLYDESTSLAPTP